MKSYEQVSCETTGRIVTLTLDRPDKLNAITPQMLDELRRAVDEAGAQNVTAIVLTGAGRAFSAGVDLKAIGNAKLDGGSVGDVLDVPARAAIDAIRSNPKPVIAKVNGFCFTGALEIALACDLVVVAEDAKLGDTHAKWGLRPTWGMSARLPMAIGLRKAKELSFTARSFSGADAERMGLANRAVPLANLDATVEELVAEMAKNSAGSITAYKQLYNRGPHDASTADEEASEFDITDTEALLAQFR